MNLYEKLQKNAIDGSYPMCMPGHKRNPKWQMQNPYSLDITEIEGFDNLHNPEGILLDLEKRAAAVYGSRFSLLLVNGSTSGILIGISAVTMPGDTILISRNSHRSVYHTAFLRQLKIEYLYEDINKDTNIPEAVGLEEVKRGLEEYPEAVLVVLTSPTYEGMTSEICKIAEVVHKAGKLLLIDAAHGAHFGFHSYFPTHPIREGADFVIQSLHKTLPSFTQTALLLWNDALWKERINLFSSIYQSSSPSYLLMAGIDCCIQFLERDSEGFNEYAEWLQMFYQKAKAWRCLTLVQASEENEFRKDYGKLVILCKHTRLRVLKLPERIHKSIQAFCGKQEVSLTGTLLYQILLAYKIQPEMAMRDYVLCMTSVCDTKEGLDYLFQTLSKIDSCCEKEEDCFCIQTSVLWKRKRMYQQYEIEKRQVRTVSLEESSGYIAAEFIYLYPPGIPYIVPGEVLEQYLIEELLSYKKSGLQLKGMWDKEGRYIRVLKETSF